MDVKKIMKEIDGFLKNEEFDKEKVIVNLNNLISFKEANPEEKSTIKYELAKHRLAKHGIYFKGFKIYYDPESMDVLCKDIHIGTIKIESRRNRPVAVITFNDDVEIVKFDNKTFNTPVNFNIVHTNKPITLQMPAPELDRLFLHKNVYYINGEESVMDEHMFRYDEESVKTFYRINTGYDKYIYFVNMTDRIRNTYWNSEYCSYDFVRYDANIDGHSNAWGLTFLLWESHLIENSTDSVYLDEDISDDDINMLIKGYENHRVAKDIKRRYAALKNKDEERKKSVIDNITSKINEMQQIINNNSFEILKATAAQLMCNPSDIKTEVDAKNYIRKRENNFGLDCGFIWFSFTDNELNNKAQEASIYGCKTHNDGSFSLNLPYCGQSTTIQSIQGSLITKILKEQIGLDISYRTELD